MARNGSAPGCNGLPGRGATIFGHKPAQNSAVTVALDNASLRELVSALAPRLEGAGFLAWVTLTGAHPAQTIRFLETTPTGCAIVSTRPDGQHLHVHALIECPSRAYARDLIDDFCLFLGCVPEAQKLEAVRGLRSPAGLRRSLYFISRYGLRLAEKREDRDHEVPRQWHVWGSLDGVDLPAGILEPCNDAERISSDRYRCLCGCDRTIPPGRQKYASAPCGNRHRVAMHRERQRAAQDVGLASPSAEPGPAYPSGRRAVPPRATEPAAGRAGLLPGAP